jgi:hypothetical protein
MLRVRMMFTIPLTWRSDSTFSDSDVMTQHSVYEKLKAIKIVVETNKSKQKIVRAWTWTLKNK